MSHALPPGLERCPVCGEYKGTTQAKFLGMNPPPTKVGDVEFSKEFLEDMVALKREYEAPRDQERAVTVRCLCEGPLCPQCGLNRVHRPGSNSYEPKSNSVGHWPLLPGFRCSECKRKDSNR